MGRAGRGAKLNAERPVGGRYSHSSMMTYILCCQSIWHSNVCLVPTLCEDFYKYLKINSYFKSIR